MEQKFRDNNKYINNKKEIYKERVLSDDDLSDNIKKSLIEWLEFKKYYYEDIGLTKLISQVKNELKEYSEEDIINIIDESMANNYKGIIFNKLKKKSTKVNSYTPTTINDDGVYRLV